MPRLSPAPHQPSAVAGAIGDSAWSQVSLPALGTTVRVAVRGGGPGLLIDAQQLLDDDDRRWNPRHPDSLVARLEAAEGPVALDDETYALVEASLVAAEATSGAVGSSGLELQPTLTRVLVPPGGVLDLDDLARARCADGLAQALVDGGAEGAVVDVDGVLRLAGSAAEGSAWVIDVGDPDEPSTVVARLGIAEGAGVTVLRPTAGLRSVTVLAPDAATAVVPAAAGEVALIEAVGLPALLVAADGTHRRLGGVEDYLRT